MSESIVPFTIIAPTIYGTMLLNRYDINQTNALVKTGMAVDHAEIMILSRILDLLPVDGKKVFVDVGANTGTHTIGIGKHLGAKGIVHAFEPQRMMFQLICGSASINSMTNVHCYNSAVGASAGVIELPQFDYFRPMNFGSIEFGPEQREALDQQRGTAGDDVEYVPRVSLDSFEWKELHVLKIDVEGMEMEVLAGATATLHRCHPVILIEYIKVDPQALVDKLKEYDYRLYDVGANFLCIPHRLASTINVAGLPEV